jgi:hypothetical protein
MWDYRDQTFIIDEEEILVQGDVDSWQIDVGGGEPQLKACLNWNEPAGNPAASQHLVNNLSLRLTSPTGVVWWGNHQLENGVWSSPGGSEDTINSLECVFIQNPEAGTWTVDVIASAIVQDSHVETAAVDADYGLVVIGGLGDRFGQKICEGVINSTGAEAQMELTGSAVVTDNNLIVDVTGLPLNSTGYAVTSMEINLVMNPGGAVGNLCIASTTMGRFLAYVQNSGSTGTVNFTPDLGAFPTSSGTEAVMAGETRYFQYWYRDQVLGFPVSNFSSAHRVTFR